MNFSVKGDQLKKKKRGEKKEKKKKKNREKVSLITKKGEKQAKVPRGCSDPRKLSTCSEDISANTDL